MRRLHRFDVRVTQAFLVAAVLISQPAAALPPDRNIHQYVVDHWSTEQGLPQVTALGILQDHRGYIWIATQDGLARFDGVSFKSYRPADHPGLAHNYIHDIHEDSENRLWIGTGKGLSVREDGTFRRVRATGEMPGAIYTLAEDRDNVVWAGTEHGLYKVAETDLGRVLQRSPSGPGSAVFSILPHPDGGVIVGGRGEIRHLSSDRGTTPVALPDEKTVVRSLARRSKTVWIGTRAGLFRRQSDRAVERIDHEVLGNRNIESLHVDRHQNLWVGTDVGLFRIREGGTVDRSRRLGLFTDAWIRSFAEDHEGNLWIGTSVDGIARLWPGHFRRYSTADGLADPLVWSFHEDAQGTLWLGTNAGVYQFDNGRYRETYGPDRLPHPMSLALLHDSNGRMWVGTRQGPAIFENGRRIDAAMDVDWPAAGVYGLVEAPEGVIWLSTREGLYRYDGDLRRIPEQSGLTQNKQRGIYHMSDGRYWVATDTGVFRGDGERFEPAGLDIGLDQFAVMSMRETADGTVWVGLQGGGLARYRDGRWTRYTAGDGLLTNNVYFIAEDGEGHLWLSSHVGVSRFEPGAFERFDTGETASLSPRVFGGMESTAKAQCNGGHSDAGLQTRSGRIWLPTLDGAIVFNPDRLHLTRTPPRVTIESITYGDETRSARTDGRRIELSPGRGDIRIDYTALSFREPENIRFRYRLHGYDDVWNEAEHRRTAFYTNLSPGRYEFELEAVAPHGPVSSKPASVSFHLQPRFHQTTAFRLALALALVGLVYGGYRWRTHALHRRGMVLERMVHNRTKRLTELNERLQQASMTDPLTGLKNRRYLLSQIPKDLAYTQRAYRGQGLFQNRDLVFLMLDLDHFKKVNDEHGHHAGDLLLTQFSEIVEDAVRESDYVIRWGGEEFLVVARHTEQAQAHILAERIRTRVEQHSFHIGNAVHIHCTCSIGGAAFPFIPEYLDAPGWEDLIDIADEAVYRAKGLGRNTWVFLHGRRQCGTENIANRVQEDLDHMIEAGEVGITTPGDEKP